MPSRPADTHSVLERKTAQRWAVCVWSFVSRVGVLYLFLAVCAVLFIDHVTFNRDVCVQALNLRMPVFAKLLCMETKPELFNPREYKKFVEYGEVLVSYFPLKVDGYGMLGFAYYHAGDIPRAITTYKKAHAGASKIFLFPYNLGVIYFKEGKYHDAAVYLQKAATTTPLLMTQFVSKAGEYQRLFAGVKDPQALILKRLEENYRNCYLLLTVSYYRIQKYDAMFRAAGSAINLGIDADGIFSYYAGIALFKKKIYGRAVGFFMESIKKNDMNPDAFSFMGLSFKALGEDEKAVIALQKGDAIRKKIGPFVDPVDAVFLPLY